MNRASVLAPAGHGWDREAIGALLVSRVPSSGVRWRRVATTAAVVVGAAAIALSSAIHLHLWLAGYRHIHDIGPLFLLQTVVGFVLATALAVWRVLVLMVGGALFMAASIGALALSATVGFLGLHDDLGVPWATPSLVVELVGLVVLVAASAVVVARR